MTPEVLERLYEPFFTTNREGGGSGLGMNIVYNLTVQKLGGKMNVRSQPGQGVHFTFEFPLELPEVIAN
jgi:signal transduction histidine kinase